MSNPDQSPESPQRDEYAMACDIALESASVSRVQRRLGIGYNRAAELLERMVSDGLLVSYSGRRAATPAPAIAAGVPAGWKLVPVNPTDEMCEAAMAIDPESTWVVTKPPTESDRSTHRQRESDAAIYYRAMLAAAPQAPVADQPAEPDDDWIDQTRQAMGMDDIPRPQTPRPGTAPLSDEQIADLCGEANRGYCIDPEHYFKAFRDAERAHGIGHPTTPTPKD